ncbi:MAG: tetratricopeptide repeat protein [Gammaproteobacteria bacterium]|nr:tetratricopeptide repeat protein [Gammaproteobacteria bacterium]MBU1655507.1 tetratricopeptide repeat protein [Gammaproteobacteria bacterium]MBU1961255.1 tetratricopeptide repeat protein [Gammaproteobacteria bacterium]
MRVLFGLAILTLTACGASPPREQTPAGPGPVMGGAGAPVVEGSRAQEHEPLTLATARPATAPRYTQREPSSGGAVRSLMQAAERQSSSGDSTAAAATLERALRIEPRNPLLLSQLARVRFDQGQYQRAVNFAAKSNSVAGANQGLRRGNWNLIAKARRAQGDEYGAREAELRANAAY